MGNRKFQWPHPQGRRQQQAKTETLPLSLKLGAAVAALLMAAALLVQFAGGRGPVPTWGQLYRTFGLEPPTAAEPAAGETSVTVLDVGQGDAVLIRQDGAACLIDAGDRDHAETLLATLRALGVDRLDLLVMTHPHADHIGGMETVVRNLPVSQMILPDFTLADYDSTLKTRLLAALAEKHIPTATAKEGDCYPLGEGTLEVLLAGIRLESAAENAADAKSAEDAVNDTSLCLRFTADDFVFLDTGDAETKEEQALADTGALRRCTLLKAGHHGSSTSSTAPLLSLARPQAVAISCGLDNDYGHPHQAALDRFAAVGAEIYRTDQEGTLTFTYSAAGLTVENADTPTAALAPAA